MIRRDSQFCIVSETAEFRRGKRQIAEWHILSREIKRRNEEERRRSENAETLAWARATAKRRLAERGGVA